MFKLNVTIKNANTRCAARAGTIVDGWHGRKDGNYSEYDRQCFGWLYPDPPDYR